MVNGPLGSQMDLVPKLAVRVWNHFLDLVQIHHNNSGVGIAIELVIMRQKQNHAISKSALAQVCKSIFLKSNKEML